MDGDMDEDELEEWKTIFNLFDVDGDQSITGEELGVVLRSMGQNPSEQELEQMINEMDEDGSGTVDFEEFVILMKRKTADNEADGHDDIEEAFKIFDRNNDGVISAEELAAVMISLGNPRTKEEIEKFLKN
ncbi:calmodulin isoform X2 [Eurytemora carolleeae]|uniref:calmodulin isoform X2 n=1 Tax=Eurytemora carolleeae TaxID=1294199 RepID=UPI000C76AB5E|nr:calmodulin isoform X2 [Eurytemora carolleeae]|eukprot:XP_023320702.1 calmodulin-like isoform X2 [Eurytemora affinis]